MSLVFMVFLLRYFHISLAGIEKIQFSPSSGPTETLNYKHYDAKQVIISFRVTICSLTGNMVSFNDRNKCLYYYLGVLTRAINWCVLNWMMVTTVTSANRDLYTRSIKKGNSQRKRLPLYFNGHWLTFHITKFPITCL